MKKVKQHGFEWLVLDNGKVLSTHASEEEALNALKPKLTPVPGRKPAQAQEPTRADTPKPVVTGAKPAQ